MTEQEEIELNKILNSNPFLPELDKWGNDISSFAEGRIQLQDLNFVLTSDKNNFEAYQRDVARRTRDGDTFLHPELLPQPFIGDPRAPIWYLLLNPGYSEIDLYDHLGICPCCSRKLFGGDVAIEDGIFDKGRNRREALVKRQELLMKQLRLECGQPFYLLDDSFNTLSSNSMFDAKTGGFGWWRTVLFGANGENDFLFPECGVPVDSKLVGHKLFAIECCPYHSVNFNEHMLWAENKYIGFWAKLIAWAVKFGRKFIVRNKNIYKLLRVNELGVGDDNSVGFSSGQNVSVTKKNLRGGEEVLDAISRALEQNL